MRRSGWFYYSWTVWSLALLAAAAAGFTGMKTAFSLVMFLILPEWFMQIYTANREKLTQQEVMQTCPVYCK